MRNVTLDKQSIKAYRQRWQTVADIEASERQSSSITERWQQLNALLRMALALEIPLPNEDIKQDEGHQRWQILYSATQNDGS